MLSENIKNLRKLKGLSQEELAARLNVVRQTVSKWEKGLSVPDADMLVSLAEALDTKVSILLGEEADANAEYDAMAAIAAKLEVVNAQLLRREERRKKIWRIVFIVLAVLSFAMLAYAIVAAGTVFYAASFPTHSDVGIIGGADGPTAIYLTSCFAPDIFRIVLTAIVAAVSIVGIVKTRAK